MATSSVKVSIRSLGEILPDSVRQAVLERMALAGVAIIQRRTERGVDVDGKGFVPYSKPYAKLRTQSGRSARPVTLHLTGNMLAGMKVVRLSAREAVIGFEGSSTGAQFARLRTRRGAPTARWTNRRTGGMTARRHVTHTLRRNAGRAVANATKALAHNEGTRALPRRHFFDFSPRERAELVKVGADAIRLVK